VGLPGVADSREVGTVVTNRTKERQDEDPVYPEVLRRYIGVAH
jgi:hypothetical protein